MGQKSHVALTWKVTATHPHVGVRPKAHIYGVTPTTRPASCGLPGNTPPIRGLIFASPLQLAL